MASVELTFDGPIARLTLNRPEVFNALDTAACELLLESVRRIEKTEGVRCLIFGGRGKHFMSGADVHQFAEFTADPELNLRHQFESMVVRRANEFCQVMERLPFPVISAVRGTAGGGGIGMACAADFVIASENAVFFPAHILVGLSPDGGLSWYLQRLLGSRMAKEVLMTGRRIPAEEALRIGLVREVVPDAELENAVDAFAEQLIAMPAKALANIKLLINQAPQHSFSDHLQLEARLLGEASDTDDFREGVTAFKEKRKPRFGQA